MDWYARRTGYWTKDLADPDTVITEVNEGRVRGTRHGRPFNVKLARSIFSVGSGSGKIRMMLFKGPPPALNLGGTQ